MKKPEVWALLAVIAMFGGVVYLLGKTKGLIEGHDTWVEQFMGDFDEEYEELAEELAEDEDE